MHVNYQFALDTVRQLAPGGRALDYGCGAGATVQAGVDAGLDMYGCEAFYGGGCPATTIAQVGLLNTRVFAMEGDRIPFADAWFDVVCDNMVFEHVPDMAVALAEIRRVLKPTGVMLSVLARSGRPISKSGSVTGATIELASK